MYVCTGVRTKDEMRWRRASVCEAWRGCGARCSRCSVRPTVLGDCIREHGVDTGWDPGSELQYSMVCNKHSGERETSWSAAALEEEPFFTDDLTWPGRRETKTFLKLITPFFHLGTIADSKTTVMPADLVR